METPSAHSSDPACARSPLARAAQSGAGLVRGLATGVRRLALGSLCPAIALWGALFVPPTFHPADIILSAIALLGLMGPAATLGLFYAGLRDLLALSGRLASRTPAPLAQSLTAPQRLVDPASSGLPQRVRRPLHRVWQLKQLLATNRAPLVRHAALLRFITPASLLLAVLAAWSAVFLGIGATSAWVLIVLL